MLATRIPKRKGAANTTAERRARASASGDNTGKRLEPIKRLIEKRDLRGSVKAVCHWPGNLGGKDAVRIKAQPYIGQAYKCLHEQAGSDQENQRERGLKYHQNVSKETRASSSSCLLASRFQSFADGCARGDQSGNKAADQCCKNRDADRKPKHHRIQSNAGRNTRGNKPLQEPNEPQTSQKS